MPLSLKSLSYLLHMEISTFGDIHFIQLNDRYILKENPLNKDVELINLETNSSQSLSTLDVTDILNFKSIELLKNYHQ
jgi:hypothetical protein